MSFVIAAPEMMAAAALRWRQVRVWAWPKRPVRLTPTKTGGDGGGRLRRGRHPQRRNHGTGGTGSLLLLGAPGNNGLA